MELSKNYMDTLRDRMSRGELTAEQANIEMVRAERVRLITSTVPADIRRALNAAVKRGELGHVKKDGHKPEAYYHPTFEYMVWGERNTHERAILKALAGVMARPDTSEYFPDAEFEL